ncbi:MAG TPA: SdrD B-like domain-containing protein [bacterium]|nr:SdrD B-like domain-containing protein [bacterium]
MYKKQSKIKRLFKKHKKLMLKKLSTVNGLFLILPMILSSLFLVALPINTVAETENMCPVAVDVVLIIDRSGSMDYTSRCDWWQLVCKNKPSCSEGYEWVKTITYNESETWCNARNQSAPHESVYLAIDPKKITAAKSAANSFVSLMGNNDQSALISYATSATLDKGLSDIHSDTQTAINNLITGGATNIGDAIKLGVDELKSARSNPQANRVMILLTDGMANKPAGPGYGEFTADVTYAENQATVAATLGYKIFTIGLGNDGEINETMLQNIAATTGASYYHSANQADLETIYNSIATQICSEYGSIAGCVYNDQNNNGIIDSGEPTLSNWNITLTNGTINQTQTSADGCYAFSGLPDSTYTITETVQAGWQQTYPSTGSQQISLVDHNGIVNIDFANYLPICGNQILDTNEVCELDTTQPCTSETGLTGTQSCNQTCSAWNECVTGETCGDGVKNGTEECDNTDGVNEHYQCTSSCTLEYIPYCGDSLINQTTEICDNDAPISCTDVNGYVGTSSCTNECGWGLCQSTEFCGDGVKNGAEVCDGSDGIGTNQECSASCTLINLPYCGDGIKNNQEICDGTDGVTSGFHCTKTCALEADQNGGGSVCGNEIIESGETCDDGNITSGDGCSNICLIEETPGEICDSSISGKKYNGNQEDNIFLQGWEIKLYDNQENFLTATSTNDEGRYLFEDLCIGTYIIKEVQQTGWQQIFPVDANKNPIFYTDIIASAGTHLNNRDFSNYYSGGSGGDEAVCGNNVREGEEICDGNDGITSGHHCTANCTLEADSPSTGSGSSSGGGGSTGAYCGDGIVNGSEQCENNSTLSAGYYCSNCTITPLTGDNNNPEANGGGPIEDEKNTNPTPTTPEGQGGGEEVEDNNLGQGQSQDGSSLALGDEVEKPTENLPIILGENKIAENFCLACANYNWLIIILLLVIATLAYRQINSALDLYNVAKEKKHLTKIYPWGFLILIATVVSWLLLYFCHFKFLLAAAVIFGLYLLLLALNVGYKKKSAIWWLWGLILALIPAISYYYCPRWGWKTWLLAVILYVATLGFYFVGLLMRKFWFVAVALGTFAFLAILVLTRCVC